jgi:hypothetical protein
VGQSINISFAREQAIWLKQFSTKNGVSASAVVRRAMTDYIRKTGKSAPEKADVATKGPTMLLKFTTLTATEVAVHYTFSNLENSEETVKNITAVPGPALAGALDVSGLKAAKIFGGQNQVEMTAQDDTVTTTENHPENPDVFALREAMRRYSEGVLESLGHRAKPQPQI